jgi:hypothetical protein
VYHILDFNKITLSSLYFPITMQFVQGSFVEQFMLLFDFSFNCGVLFLVLLLSFYLFVCFCLFTCSSRIRFFFFCFSLPFKSFFSCFVFCSTTMLCFGSLFLLFSKAFCYFSKWGCRDSLLFMCFKSSWLSIVSSGLCNLYFSFVF